eukprot:1783255-Rhodomonas_salina.1
MVQHVDPSWLWIPRLHHDSGHRTHRSGGERSPAMAEHLLDAFCAHHANKNSYPPSSHAMSCQLADNQLMPTFVPRNYPLLAELQTGQERLNVDLLPC